MYNYISQDYLMHYGVKGMKWGVRHDKNVTKIAKAKVSNAKVYIKSDEGRAKIKKGAKIAGTVLVVAGAVTMATIIGLEAYKYGQMNADMVLDKGTQIQSIAPSEKSDWSKTYYAAVNKDDKRKILKNFSSDTSRRAKKAGLSGDVRANIFENSKQEKIAGMKNMKKAYKTVNGGSTKGFKKFVMSYGAKTEEQRQPFMKELNKRGYSGFRDIDGMTKWWGGKTPVIISGNNTSFNLKKNPIVHVDKLSNVPVKNVEGRMQTVTDISYKVLPAATLSATALYATAYSDDMRKNIYYYKNNNKKKNKKRKTRGR